jgi:23S rRNA pseudouridine2605 synthase
VGRLDRASEGLLLFTNDSAWAAALTDPARHVDKVYHVQIGTVAGEDLLRALELGVTEGGECLAVKRAHLLRHGEHTSWLELTLDEGRNRHLRRLFAALGIEVRRLVRVAVGPLALGDLAKGAWRRLTAAEIAGLTARGGR